MPLPAPLVAPMGNRCSRCPAVCCRLTVVLMPEDRVPAHLTATTAEGLHVMAREPDGWCAALDPLQMNCTIYAQRPSTCRRFVMDGPYCSAAREQYQSQSIGDPDPAQSHNL
ncbi:MAG: YkgJ family cysteine cluster protein [Stenotrophomonas sp.]